MRALKRIKAWFQKGADASTKKKLKHQAFLEKLHEALGKGNFDGSIKYLHALGLSLQKEFHTQNKNERKDFRKYILSQIDSQNSTETLGVAKPWKRSWNLRCLLEAWGNIELKDTELGESVCAATFVGLYAEVVSLAEEVLYLAKTKENQEKYNISKLINEQLGLLKATEINKKTSVKQLIAIISNCIVLLKQIDPELAPPEKIKANYLQAGKSIASFQRVSEKFFRWVGISLAFSSGLTCGLTTGICIFLLVSGPWGLAAACSLGVVIFLAGFIANFNFFYKDTPSFFHALVNAKMTEFIDKEGKRVELSTTKKFLLIPAALVSVAVGITCAAFTMMSGPQLVAIIFPFLTALWPPLPFILIGILAATYCVAITMAMFKAFVNGLQNPLPSFKSFLEKIKSLSFRQWIAYAAKATIVAFALFGLFFLCFTGLDSLVALLGPILSQVIGWAAFIGQIPFTMLTVDKLCDAFGNFLVHPKKTIINFFSQVRGPLEFLGLIANALGNAALVIKASVVSAVAGASCFIISWAGNRVDHDKGKAIRDNADQLAISNLQNSAKKINEIHQALASNTAGRGPSTAPLPNPNSTLRRSKSSSSLFNRAHPQPVRSTMASSFSSSAFFSLKKGSREHLGIDHRNLSALLKCL